jgi:hypothetical protein
MAVKHYRHVIACIDAQAIFLVVVGRASRRPPAANFLDISESAQNIMNVVNVIVWFYTVHSYNLHCDYLSRG